MIQCPQLEAAPVGGAQQVRMTLGRSDFKSYAVLILFSLNYNALQQLSKLLWGEEDESSSRRRD